MYLADVLGKWKFPGSHKFQSDEVETAMELQYDWVKRTQASTNSK
jgi:hypothetical protein